MLQGKIDAIKAVRDQYRTGGDNLLEVKTLVEDIIAMAVRDVQPGPISRRAFIDDIAALNNEGYSRIQGILLLRPNATFTMSEIEEVGAAARKILKASADLGTLLGKLDYDH